MCLAVKRNPKPLLRPLVGWRTFILRNGWLRPVYFQTDPLCWKSAWCRSHESPTLEESSALAITRTGAGLYFWRKRSSVFFNAELYRGRVVGRAICYGPGYLCELTRRRWRPRIKQLILADSAVLTDLYIGYGWRKGFELLQHNYPLVQIHRINGGAE